MPHMERYAGARNVLIILAIAAAVYFIPGGGRTAATVGAVLAVAFAAVVGLFAGRTYQERRVAIYSLGDRKRAILYGAIAVAVVTVTATPRLWATGAGEIAWFAILAAVVYTLVALYRSSRSY